MGVGGRVVLGVAGRVLEPKIRRQVDDELVGLEEARHPRHRFAVRRRHERGVRGTEFVMGTERQRGRFAKVGMRPPDGPARHRVRGDLGDLRLGVTEQKAKEFAAHIAGSADDRDLHFRATPTA